MLPLLLIGCDLPAPDPLDLSVGLPAAQHAGSTPARDFLHLRPGAEPTSAEHEALCDWMRGEAPDDHIAQKLQARGDMGFALLEISSTAVRLGGAVVLPLTDGVIPADARRGNLISALYDALSTEVEARKSTADRCQITPAPPLAMLLAVEPGVPLEATRSLFYTATQAQLESLYLMVSGPAGDALPTGLSAPEERQLTVQLLADDSRLYTRRDHPTTEPHQSLSAAAPLLEGGSLGCGLLLPSQATRWSAVISEMDALAQQGASRFILETGAGGSAQTSAAPPPAELSLSLDATVAAFLLMLPESSPVGSEGATTSTPECHRTSAAAPAPAQLEAAIPGDAGDAYTLADVIAHPEQLLGANVTAVHIGQATIDGPLRPELLQEAVQQIRGPLRSCYQQQVRQDGPLPSALTVQFTVRSSGAVSSTRILEDTASEAVTACITGRIERLKLPRLPGNLTATVTIPLTFSFQ